MKKKRPWRAAGDMKQGMWAVIYEIVLRGKQVAGAVSYVVVLGRKTLAKGVCRKRNGYMQLRNTKVLRNNSVDPNQFFFLSVCYLWSFFSIHHKGMV